MSYFLRKFAHSGCGKSSLIRAIAIAATSSGLKYSNGDANLKGSGSNQTGRRFSAPLIIAVTLIIVIVLILLSSTFTYVYFWRRRLIKTKVSRRTRDKIAVKRISSCSGQVQGRDLVTEENEQEK
ncbi:hypothetical protein K1719_016490 [Acacia pycnantha]|nr:hypothetical protein K1719_016490 [Acacia pycnantha]